MKLNKGGELSTEVGRFSASYIVHTYTGTALLCTVLQRRSFKGIVQRILRGVTTKLK
jgi:hypothetical protein